MIDKQDVQLLNLLSESNSTIPKEIQQGDNAILIAGMEILAAATEQRKMRNH
ncbi:MAG TPA: hypothetical protein VJ765_06695 [Chitinophagaceae bacterium]|nr:hypothetical protein [Chitinophagaceae bacterium]